MRKLDGQSRRRLERGVSLGHVKSPETGEVDKLDSGINIGFPFSLFIQRHSRDTHRNSNWICIESESSSVPPMFLYSNPKPIHIGYKVSS